MPLRVAALAGIHAIRPSGRPTQIGLALAYVAGGLVAAFLLVGFMIPGGTPAEYEAYVRVAAPLLLLYGGSVLALVFKVR